MRIPSQDDRLEIWRCTYARSSLIDALLGCEKLRDGRSIAPEWKKALVSLIVISYARPFTKSQFTASKRDYPLHEGCVPKDKKLIHEGLLEMRDRAIGHKDAVAFTGTPLNRVLIRARGRSIDLHTVFPGDIQDPILTDAIDLCRTLIAHCDRAVAPFVQAHLLRTTPLPEGDYLLSTEDDSSPWLKKVK